jgi:hypothetical protein
MSNRATLDATVSEAQWESTVVPYARVRGWRCFHVPKGQTVDGGWLTVVSEDGAGWPDWQFVRDRIVYAELKTMTGRLSKAQKSWMVSLRAAGAEFHVWRPSSWNEVERCLK